MCHNGFTASWTCVCVHAHGCVHISRCQYACARACACVTMCFLRYATTEVLRRWLGSTEYPIALCWQYWRVKQNERKFREKQIQKRKKTRKYALGTTCSLCWFLEAVLLFRAIVIWRLRISMGSIGLEVVLQSLKDPSHPSNCSSIRLIWTFEGFVNLCYDICVP